MTKKEREMQRDIFQFLLQENFWKLETYFFLLKDDVIDLRLNRGKRSIINEVIVLDSGGRQ